VKALAGSREKLNLLCTTMDAKRLKVYEMAET
jgi:hypothetical protein